LVRRQSEIGDLREEDGKELGLFGEKEWGIIVVGGVISYCGFTHPPIAALGHPLSSPLAEEGVESFYFVILERRISSPISMSVNRCFVPYNDVLAKRGRDGSSTPDKSNPRILYLRFLLAQAMETA